jgi:hypothetical protein
LADAGFSREEITQILDKYRGTPGYLKIVKDTKRANPDFDIDSAPEDLERLIGEQVDLVLQAANPQIVKSLEILSITPSSYPVSLVTEMVGVARPLLLDSLEKTTLVRVDLNKDRVEYVNDLVQSAVKSSVSARIQKIIQEVLEHLRANCETEEALVTSLLGEARDYEGISSALTRQAVISAIDRTSDVSSIMKRFRFACDLARERGNTEDLVRWTLGLATTKAFFSHAASDDDIRALLSIGRFQEALSKAYAIPEVFSRVRLLAKVYSAMKERGDRIPGGALQELASLVSKMDYQSLEKDVVQAIAVDLFPVLPDEAFALLEKVVGQSRRRSVIEVAIQAIEGERQTNIEDISSSSKTEINLGQIARLLSSWLNDLPFTELLVDIEKIETTEAKEYIIRQWCRQNKESSDIIQAVNLWLDTVIADKDFVILVRSLRHISEVVLQVQETERKGLINRLQAPGFLSRSS